MIDLTVISEKRELVGRRGTICSKISMDSIANVQPKDDVNRRAQLRNQANLSPHSL